MRALTVVPGVAGSARLDDLPEPDEREGMLWIQAHEVDPALAPHGVLIEPASVVAKAWDHIERIGRRAR